MREYIHPPAALKKKVELEIFQNPQEEDNCTKKEDYTAERCQSVPTAELKSPWNSATLNRRKLFVKRHGHPATEECRARPDCSRLWKVDVVFVSTTACGSVL